MVSYPLLEYFFSNIPKNGILSLFINRLLDAVLKRPIKKVILKKQAKSIQQQYSMPIFYLIKSSIILITKKNVNKTTRMNE